MKWGKKKENITESEAPVETGIIDTAPAEHKQEQETKQPPTPEEIAEIKEQMDYYGKNYRGLINPVDLPSQTINPVEAEIASLLFGILQEIRKLREDVKNGNNNK